MKKAIFFDMDGVLVDSVEGNFSAWQKVLLEFGIRATMEELMLYEGMKSEVMVQEIAASHMVEISLGEIMQLQREKRQIQSECYSIEPYPVFEKLLSLKEMEIKLYVVSGSPRERVLSCVQNFFPGIFDNVISACDVTLGKPHPEPFLRAQDFSGFETEECLVIENAPLGIDSSLKAGIEVIAIGTTLDQHHLSKAHHFVENHKELFDLIEVQLLNKELLQ
jgi:beta-phosphoglucomutase